MLRVPARSARRARTRRLLASWALFEAAPEPREGFWLPGAQPSVGRGPREAMAQRPARDPNPLRIGAGFGCAITPIVV